MLVYGSVGLLATVAGLYVLSPRSTHSDDSTSDPSSTSVASTLAAGEVPVQSSTLEISVRVVYFGMPQAVTGTKKETIEMDAPAMLSDLKSTIVELHPSLRSMLPLMLFLVAGVPVTSDVQLENDVEVDVLAMSAGG